MFVRVAKSDGYSTIDLREDEIFPSKYFIRLYNRENRVHAFRNKAYSLQELIEEYNLVLTQDSLYLYFYLDSKFKVINFLFTVEDVMFKIPFYQEERAKAVLRCAIACKAHIQAKNGFFATWCCGNNELSYEYRTHDNSSVDTGNLSDLEVAYKYILEVK